MKKGKGGSRSNGLLPNSLKIISSCLKTVSANAGTVVRSAGASVAASINTPSEDQKDQVLWAGFDKLELGPSSSRYVLLLGYLNGFQIIDVEDASNVHELVSKRDGPVTFLQMQPIPKTEPQGPEGFRASHPLLITVANDENDYRTTLQGWHSDRLTRDGIIESELGHNSHTPTAVRFYSLKSDSYVHVLRFRSAVNMIRCSSQIVAVALASQIYLFDAITLENKFSVLTYPMPQHGQGSSGVNIGYGPMAVGPRWLAYASNNPLLSNTGLLSPQNLTPSPGVSPSTSPGSGNLVARYAMESSKQLANGIINLGDIGYKTFSKYCQDLLPDGSNSPVSPSSNWKVGRITSAANSTDIDNAGMVVVKDFTSKVVISQFRAHTSPISALCFDRSGTLLVTASVQGHNINVFRIMPSRLQNSANSGCYDWMMSHVHLYKLYRGLTTAVIQDICFSYCGQWVAIISSRGTCHIFLLSPFGGDVGLLMHRSHGDQFTILPSLSLPWWSASSCGIDQQPKLPPPTVTLSVVSRIKNGNFGWLSTVSNATSSSTCKISVPSGAIAAVFHNSIHKNLQSVQSRSNSLEHLLVFSPSGHLIQYELLPSLGVEASESSFKSGLGLSGSVQDEESRVRAEPIQWWDVCRRSHWPEREEAFSMTTLDDGRAAQAEMNVSNCVSDTMHSKSLTSCLVGKDHVNTQKEPYQYLSNAEVQLSSGILPIWQKSKVFFYMMTPNQFASDSPGGEIEIENIPLEEVEIRRNDLLPVFEHFRSTQSGWIDRALVRRSSQSFPPAVSYCTKNKYTELLTNDTKSTPVGFMESPNDGTAGRTGYFDLGQASLGGSCESGSLKSIQNQICFKPVQCSMATRDLVNNINTERNGGTAPLFIPEQLNAAKDVRLENKCSNTSVLLEPSDNGDVCIANDLFSSGSNSISVRRPETEFISNSNLISDIPNSSIPNSTCSTLNVNTESEHGDLNNSLGFVQYCCDGYYKISALDDCRELAEVVTDADSSSSHCEREKLENDEDYDNGLGGMFAFSEEG